MPAPLRLEDALLLTAANPALSPPRAARMLGLIERRPHWPRVVAEAERHGMQALLHSHLAALPEATVPPAARASLAAGARRCVAWNLLLRHELRRLLGGFARAGIDAMPLKGPVLADQLYPDPLLRPTGDLDLLLRPPDALPAEAILREGGYRRLPEREQGAEYHTRFVSGVAGAAGAVVVELHHELGEGHASRPEAAAIWAAAVPGVWAGQPVWHMALCDLVVYLCFHAAKDGLASLRALLDVTLLLERRRDEIPWGAVTRHARAAHLAAPVHLTLVESRALLGAPVPDPALAGLRPRPWRRHLVRTLFDWRGGVLHAPDALLVGPVMAVLMMLWDDAPRAMQRHLRRNLAPSARLRDRWIEDRPGGSWLGGYPGWLWRAARLGTRQLVSRTREV